VHRVAVEMLAREEKQQSDAYLLALDATEEEDFKEGNGSADCVLIENEEACVPTMSKSVVTCRD
jgi:hypothetical protein